VIDAAEVYGGVEPLPVARVDAVYGYEFHLRSNMIAMAKKTEPNRRR